VIAIIIALLFITLTIENGYKTDGMAQKTKEGTVIKAREQQPYTTSVQNIVDDFRGRGTLTEFVFVFLKNLWRMSTNLPGLLYILSTFNTQTYAGLIKWFGRFILNYPASLRALPGKILTGMIPTINALPAWLRQSPIILQVFPLLIFLPFLFCFTPCLLLPIGPQVMVPLPSLIRFLLSLAENSLAILIGFLALPASALLSVIRGLPGSLRTVIYHVLDFVLTPFVLLVRAIPVMSFFISLIGLWFIGMILAFIFSPFLLLAPFVIFLAIFLEGTSDEGIKSSVSNLPENVANVYMLVDRLFGSFGGILLTPIAPFLDRLLAVDWLTATSEMPVALPEALGNIGSAIPNLVTNAPGLLKTLINSGLTFTTQLVFIDQWMLVLIQGFIDMISRLPQLALLAPAFLEIMSAVSIHLPEIIREYIPSSFSALNEMVKNLPDFLPSIVLTTMSCNVIFLEFARSVWRLSMRWSEVIIQLLWGFILICPILPLDADAFVTPWFGPRFFSLLIFVPVLAISMILIILVMAFAMLTGGLLGALLIGIYIVLMVFVAILTALLSIAQALTSILSSINIVIAAGGGAGFSLGFLPDCVGALSSLTSACGVLTNALLPFLMVIPLLLILIPLAIVMAILVLAGAGYFVGYMFMILIGVLVMVLSLPLEAVFYVLLAIFGNVPVLGTMLGLWRTFTNFYAFCIPPNFIEVITQALPLCVNMLSSAPAVIFMPISLTTTIMGALRSLISAMPSIPGYALRLGSRFIFSMIAEVIALVSLVIDAIVSAMLIIFAVFTSLLFECLNLSIIESMPQIIVLSMALMCVTCASLLDIFAILVLRLPDMISEYAYSVLKSSAMMPVLSSIIPSIPAAPAMLQPEVLIEGISMMSLGILLMPLAIPGALMVLVYNLITWLIRTLYRISPRIVTLPLDLTRRCFSTLDNIVSGITSTLNGAASRIETGVIPYA
jgi:hypothetical protein